MEMIEEGEIQAEFSPNRIKFQEFVGEEEEDRISGLPDCLLHEILSRLPSTREAIITGTLSKRWKHVWTWVHTLSFTSLYIYRLPRYPDFVSFVDKTLTQCRQLNLKKFQVISGYDIRFESQVNNWIRFAISRNVEELILRVSDGESQAEVLVDQFFFLSSCFTHLTLQGCKLNPTGAISWMNLTSLFISFVKLDQDLIQNILSGSPLLETLVLNGCYGYRRLDLSTSKSVNNLVFLGFFDPDDVLGANDIEINAPNILSLTIQGYLSLWKLLLVNVSSLVEANLDFKYMCRSRTTRAKAEAEEEMLKGLILNLRHVKELKIWDLCSKAVSRLEAKGFVFPSNIKFTYLVENRIAEVILLDDGPDDNEVN